MNIDVEINIVITNFNSASIGVSLSDVDGKNLALVHSVGNSIDSCGESLTEGNQTEQKQ